MYSVSTYHHLEIFLPVPTTLRAWTIAESRRIFLLASAALRDGRRCNVAEPGHALIRSSQVGHRTSMRAIMLRCLSYDLMSAGILVDIDSCITDRRFCHIQVCCGCRGSVGVVRLYTPSVKEVQSVTTDAGQSCALVLAHLRQDYVTDGAQ